MTYMADIPNKWVNTSRHSWNQVLSHLVEYVLIIVDPIMFSALYIKRASIKGWTCHTVSLKCFNKKIQNVWDLLHTFLATTFRILKDLIFCFEHFGARYNYWSSQKMWKIDNWWDTFAFRMWEKVWSWSLAMSLKVLHCNS